MKMRYGAVGRGAAFSRIRLSRMQAVLASLYAGTVLSVAFLIPVAQLAWWSREDHRPDGRYWMFTVIPLLASSALLVASVFLLLARRRTPAQQQCDDLRNGSPRSATPSRGRYWWWGCSFP